jgi:excisionase family DNA binding protein
VSARYLTLKDAAARVSTSPETVRYWIHVGKLRAFKPGRSVLVRESDLEALIEASAVDALRAARARGKGRLRAVGAGR